MKKLHLLILRSFFGPFFLIFFIVLFVLLIQFLWRYIDELVGKGLDTGTIGELLLYTSASLVPMALPLSILMSSLMTFGNLGEKYELTAIKASGISLQRILRSLIVLVFGLSIGAFFFANNVLPYANLQMRSLLYDIRQQRPEMQIKPSEFNSLIEGYSIRVNEKDPKTNVMYGVTIYDHSEGKGNNRVILADSSTMVVTANDKYLIMTLYDGYGYTELIDTKKPQKKRSYPHRYDKFKEQQIIIELSGFGLQRTDQSLFKSHYSMLNINQLEIMRDSLDMEITLKENQMSGTLLRGNFFKLRERNQKPKRPRSNTLAQKDIETSANISKSERIKQQKDLKNTTIENAKSDQANAPPITALTDSSDESKLLDEKAVFDPTKIINIDSLYSTYTLKEKAKITTSALAFSRTAKNLIANSHQSLDFKIEQLRRYEIEWHRKFTISFACMLFMFIGAPLGAIIRKGGLGLPLILSILFFILYYILSLTGEKLVRESVVLDYQGMWGTSAIFLLIGAFITYKATTDSSLFNMDTYTNFIKRIFGQRYNVVDMINIRTQNNDTKVTAAKIDNINTSLTAINDSIDDLLESDNFSFKPTNFGVSLFSLHNNSELIIFERFYINTFSAIINHPVFHNKNIRAKAFEFPAFNAKEFQGTKLTQIIYLILAFIPPLTLIAAGRQYIKLIVFRSKLKQIKQLIPEMGTLLKITEAEEKRDENTTSM